MDRRLFQASLAELIGTFVLVFVGAGGVIVAPLFGVTAPALAHGLILVALIYTYGHISGAQFNPAVTLGLLVGGKESALRSVAFIIAQFIGGIIAAFAISALIPHGNADFMGNAFGDIEFNYGVTTGFLTQDYVWMAAGIEAILTFFLVSTIYQAAVYGKGGNLAGVAIGFTLAAAILAGGALTGASLNPARTLGPALAAGDLSYVIPYFVGAFGGGIVAGLLHSYVLPPENV